MIIDPLRLHDCSLISDGAAAVVLSESDEAKAVSYRVVEIAGLGMATERLQESVRPNMHELIAGKIAVNASVR